MCGEVLAPTPHFRKVRPTHNLWQASRASPKEETQCNNPADQTTEAKPTLRNGQRALACLKGYIEQLAVITVHVCVAQ